MLYACIGGPVALAASGGGGQALEIAPPLIPLRANPGQTLNTTIDLRDISKTDLIVTNQINDFVANGEDGTPKILTGNNYNDPFSMKNWISPLPSFQLAPQKIETLNISISVPTNASPGGHYGVIRFTGTPPQMNGTGVSLSASVGALVLLTVNGKINDQLSVQEFSVNDGGKNAKAGSFFESAPLGFVVRLKNSGNIQEEPIGNIKITDMFGRTTAGVNINIPPHNVLPDSIRKFTATIDKTVIGNKRLFGRYHADLYLSYGTGTQKVLTASLTFWVIPWKLILTVVVALIAAFFVLRALLHNYKRRIISKAQVGGQAVHRTSPPKQRKRASGFRRNKK